MPSLSVETEKRTNGNTHQRRDLKTVVWHADEEAYQKILEPKGGKEDMWQGGDVSVATMLCGFVLLTDHVLAGITQTHPRKLWSA